MPLDLGTISDQVNRMTGEFVSRGSEALTEEALDQLQSLDADDLRARLDAPKFNTSWLVARPLDTLWKTHGVPQRPSSFSVVAADGSSIAPDRHNPVRYYVVNTGTALLSYGAEPDAHLRAQGRLFYEESDLYFPHDHKTIPVAGSLLALKMALSELETLLAVARTAPAEHPVIALRDGSLIFWALQAEEEEVRSHFLRELSELLNGFLDARIPLASYVSYPGSRDVINLLRVGLCPDNPVSCDHCTARATKRVPACLSLSRTMDRWLFERVLPVGSRSDVFVSSSPILKHYGELHEVGFFYLNVDEEVARVEAPLWVLQDERNLGLVHALVFDQCVRGRGYPSSLKEAHEQAVISSTERRIVEEMVEESLSTRNVVVRRSAKDTHKRQRGL